MIGQQIVWFFALVIASDFIEEIDASLSPHEAELCTYAHNKLRRLHQNTPPLRWDDSLAAKAQQYAEELVRMNRRSNRLKLIHETSSELGENIYWSDNQNIATCVDASLSWYIEIDDYSYSTASTINGNMIGHFTQLVWKSTQKFGVGIATMPSRKYSRYGNTETFVVAKYSPRGNFYHIGQKLKDYTRNVQPRIPGSLTPTLQELEGGHSKKLLSPKKCENLAGDEKCNNFIHTWGYSCHDDAQYEQFFEEKCSKTCGYC